MSLKHGISGYTVVRNALKLDYCIDLCLDSMLSWCEEVVVCESDSSDDTREHLERRASVEPKLRIVHRPWPHPFANPCWFMEWINEARQHLRYAQQFMLDADEVLDQQAVPVLKSAKPTDCFWFHRYNFIRDARTLVPHGEGCGYEVARFGPTDLFMPSDEVYSPEAHPGPEPEIRQRATHNKALRIMHYGFLRHPDAMLAKNQVNTMAFRGERDVRIARAAMHPERPWYEFVRHANPYGRYDGEHPEAAHAWLKERGAL